MGFFDVLKNVATGKPGFEVPPDGNVSNNNGQSPYPTDSGAPQQAPNGPKQIPRVEVERVETHSDPSRPHMQVSTHIQNNSNVPVEIDWIRLLNVQRQLGAKQLDPGESFEFLAYDGPRPTQTGGVNDDATVRFKDLSGDYFESQHRVEFRQEPDHTYLITRIIYTAPKDT
jgi:hypothetical protein